jgi:hypothetical protein
MPRINENPNPTNNEHRGKPITQVDDRTKMPGYQPAPQIVHRNPTPIYVKDGDIELKLRILDDKIAQFFVPLDFTKNKEITGLTAQELANSAYIYVDNNGTPVKVLVTSLREIDWANLTGPAQAKIQNLINTAVDNAKLIAGDNININGRVISANIGVKTLNGQDGDVSLTAGDLNAYTKDDVYKKEETYSAEQVEDALEDLIVDGGAYR